MKKAPVLTLITAGAISLLVAAQGSTSPQAPSNPFASLIRWVRATGKPSVVRKIVAQSMKLGGEDLAVIERGFRRDGNSPTHVLAVSNQDPIAPQYVILGIVEENTGAGTLWKSSSNGTLLQTVNLDGAGNVTAVTDATYADVFAAEKQVFIHRMLSESRVNDSAAPTR